MRLASAAVAFLVGCATAPDPKAMVEVGFMDRDCSAILNNQRLPTIPIGFKVTPVQAAQALPKPRGCHSKFFFTVYADDTNYYFFNNTHHFLEARTVDLVRASSYIVSGHSGLLTQEPAERKP